MTDYDKYLIPVDQHVTKLQKEIDDMLWEGEDAHTLEWELRHFLKLQAAGVVYEARF